METLDCADPSLIAERRNETLTALQALTLHEQPVHGADGGAICRTCAKRDSPDLPGQIDAAAGSRSADGDGEEPRRC